MFRRKVRRVKRGRRRMADRIVRGLRKVSGLGREEAVEGGMVFVGAEARSVFLGLVAGVSKERFDLCECRGGLRSLDDKPTGRVRFVSD